MDSSDGLILWILGGTGITLLYAAYKGKSPLAVLSNHLSSSGAVKATASGNTPTVAAGGSTAETASYSSHGTPYSVGMAGDGTQYVYDGNGSPISVLPANYSSTPSTYIPVQGTFSV